MGALAELGKNLTSPAKIAFAGYVIFVWLTPDRRPPWWQFLLISGVFVLVQILHDDFLRIWFESPRRDNATSQAAVRF